MALGSFFSTSLLTFLFVSLSSRQASSLVPLGGRLYGIHHVGITTDSLANSLIFYRDILGGTLLDKLVVDNERGDPDYYMRFQKELLDARANGSDSKTYGIPDIRKNGPENLNIRYVLFDNLLVELVEHREVTSQTVFNARYPHTSPSFLGTVTISFWLKDDINLDDFVKSLESAIQDQGLSKAKVNRISDSPGSSSVVSFDRKYPGLEGMSFVRAEGPSGEQIEFVKMTGPAEVACSAAFKQRGAVTKAYNSASKPSTSLASSFYGLHHVGVTVEDLEAAADFYINILGGSLIGSLTGNNVRGDAFFHSYFHHKLAASRATSISLSEAGIANISSSGAQKLDFIFVLFDNMMIRLDRYSSYPAGDRLFVASQASSSPAYIANGRLGFWIKESSDINDFVHDLQMESASEQLTHVQGNRAIDVSSKSDLKKYYSVTWSTGRLAGLSYAYVKGPSSEQLEFVKLTGSADAEFKTSFTERGAVSKAYGSEETTDGEKGETESNGEKKEEDESNKNVAIVAGTCSVAVVIAVMFCIFVCVFPDRLKKKK